MVYDLNRETLAAALELRADLQIMFAQASSAVRYTGVRSC